MIGFEREPRSDGGNKDEIRKLSRIVKTPSTAVHGHHRGTHKTDLWLTITRLRVSVNYFLFIYTYPLSRSVTNGKKKTNTNSQMKCIMRKRASAEFPTALACRVKVFIKTPRRVDRIFFLKNCTRCRTVKFCRLSNKHGYFTLQLPDTKDSNVNHSSTFRNGNDGNCQ